MNRVSPIQPRLLSKINEHLVLRMIQDTGPSTRAEVSKAIGITFPTVAKAVSSLLDSKLLEEVEESSTGPGRPAKLVRLASRHAQVVGITLSASECAVAAASLSGSLHDTSPVTFPTPATYDSLLVHITRHAKQLMPPGGRSTLIMGVSIPGIVDYRQQRVALSANLPVVNGKSIGKDLQALLGVECLMVRDTHALTLSERLHSGGTTVANFATLDLCAGVGLGIMVDGQILTGDSGFAGELGHIAIVPNGDLCHCGKRGCLETVASEWALEAKISLQQRRTVKIPEILEMARAGDKRVLAELDSMCEYLALAMGHVLNIINPGTFYVYGRAFQSRPQLLELLAEKTKQYALEPSMSTCKFVMAKGGVLDGTVACVINYLTDSLMPDLDGYVRFAGITVNRPRVVR